MRALSSCKNRKCVHAGYSWLGAWGGQHAGLLGMWGGQHTGRLGMWGGQHTGLQGMWGGQHPGRLGMWGGQHTGRLGTCAAPRPFGHVCSTAPGARAHTLVRFRAPSGVRGWFGRGCFGGKIYSILFTAPARGGPACRVRGGAVGRGRGGLGGVWRRDCGQQGHCMGAVGYSRATAWGRARHGCSRAQHSAGRLRGGGYSYSMVASCGAGTVGNSRVQQGKAVGYSRAQQGPVGNSRAAAGCGARQ